MIDIQQLIPERLTFIVWDKEYKTDLTDWKYIVREQLNQDLETDNVLVYTDKWLFDTIDKRIVLRSGDILHLEYTIDVW